MAALVKGVLFVGVVVLLGAGVFTRFVAPEPPDARRRRTLRLVAALAATAVALAGLFDVVATLRGVLGFVDPALVRDYLGSTRHGAATLVRLPLLAAAAATAVPPGRPGGMGGALFSLSGLALLASFSLVGHNAAMGGWFPPVADLIHMTAAATWAGSVLFTAFAVDWRTVPTASLTRSIGRLSAIGLGAVLVLTASGLYSSWLHVSPPALATTSYGRSLLVKVALVAVILAVAAVNRWALLPALRARGATRGLARSLRIEAVLLLAVLAATALLTTRPVPH